MKDSFRIKVTLPSQRELEDTPFGNEHPDTQKCDICKRLLTTCETFYRHFGRDYSVRYICDTCETTIGEWGDQLVKGIAQSCDKSIFINEDNKQEQETNDGKPETDNGNNR